MSTLNLPVRRLFRFGQRGIYVFLTFDHFVEFTNERCSHRNVELILQIHLDVEVPLLMEQATARPLQAAYSNNADIVTTPNHRFFTILIFDAPLSTTD